MMLAVKNCGLLDAKIRAFDNDLHVNIIFFEYKIDFEKSNFDNLRYDN